MTQSQPPNGKGRAFATFATNVAKIGGVVLGVHAGLQDHPDQRVMALAAVMVLGVQGLESLLDRLFR